MVYAAYTVYTYVYCFPQHEAEFTEILTGVKGGAGERRLTSQFIARFFQHFPNQQEEALNALFDLCEDDDVAVSQLVATL